jgi:hypothetical protein
MMTSRALEPEQPVLDLADESLEEVDETLETQTQPPAVVERLRNYQILPPQHAKLPERVLSRVEELFASWYGLGNDEERRAILPDLLGSEAEIREILLAVVPIYFDSFFFDEKMPTRDLVDLVLIGHGKWRRWLASAGDH